jgi:hypothetical protein
MNALEAAIGLLGLTEQWNYNDLIRQNGILYDHLEKYRNKKEDVKEEMSRKVDRSIRLLNAWSKGSIQNYTDC